MLNKNCLKLIKHILVILVLTLCFVFMQNGWHRYSILFNLPNIYSVTKTMNEAGVGFLIKYMTLFEERLYVLILTGIAYIISNMTLKYRRRKPLNTSHKLCIIIPVAILALEVVVVGYVYTPMYLFPHICWYMIFNTIFEPIPMFKKKSAPITSMV